jgi:hypothetical protein
VVSSRRYKKNPIGEGRQIRESPNMVRDSSRMCEEVGDADGGRTQETADDRLGIL